MTNDEYYRSLSDADWDRAEAIEAEIWEILRQGFTEDVAVKFVRTVMEVRAAVPEATVGGTFNYALLVGLDYLSDKSTLARLRSAACPDGIKQKKTRGKLAGAGL